MSRIALCPRGGECLSDLCEDPRFGCFKARERTTPASPPTPNPTLEKDVASGGSCAAELDIHAWTNSFGRHGVSVGDKQVASTSSRSIADVLESALKENGGLDVN